MTPEAADLENKKRSIGLALKRLREQLERGETPRELMDQLGYTEHDLEAFLHRLEERLSDPGTSQTPEAEAARRQFESLLKGIRPQSEGQLRSGGDHERKASESYGAANRPAPPDLRKASEGFKRKLSTEKPSR